MNSPSVLRMDRSVPAYTHNYRFLRLLYRSMGTMDVDGVIICRNIMCRHDNDYERFDGPV